jgi:hypothetical protein
MKTYIKKRESVIKRKQQESKYNKYNLRFEDYSSKSFLKTIFIP